MRRFPKEHIMSNKQLFNDPVQRKRYICALLMILLMVGVSELMGEKEIIFPEMAALTSSYEKASHHPRRSADKGYHQEWLQFHFG